MDPRRGHGVFHRSGGTGAGSEAEEKGLEGLHVLTGTTQVALAAYD